MASWAKPGVKCQCIRTTNLVSPECRGMSQPVVGSVYTVNHVETDDEGDVYVGLDEIHQDVVVAVDLLRPLVSQSDDVAKFTHLLNTTKQTESA